MTNIERCDKRNKGMVYVGDEQVFAEMAECKKKLKNYTEHIFPLERILL